MSIWGVLKMHSFCNVDFQYTMNTMNYITSYSYMYKHQIDILIPQLDAVQAMANIDGSTICACHVARQVWLM